MTKSCDGRNTELNTLMKYTAFYWLIDCDYWFLLIRLLDSSSNASFKVMSDECIYSFFCHQKRLFEWILCLTPFIDSANSTENAGNIFRYVFHVPIEQMYSFSFAQTYVMKLNPQKNYDVIPFSILFLSTREEHLFFFQSTP